MMKSKLIMCRPFFSIIIATYNSEKTLEYSLKSIREQNFNQDDIEILVVDGGSSDTTLSIAQKYGAKIFHNQKRLPEYAKLIGDEKATGYYALRLDSDEEFISKNQLADKKDFLLKHDEIKVMIENLKEPGRSDICGISAAYLNILGDPFSYFIYNTKEDKCTTYQKYITFSDGKYNILRFNDDDMPPLADSGGSLYSLDYIRTKYPDKYNTIEFTCGIYDRLIRDTGICGCIKGDNVKHNCKSDFKTYLRKLKFRVINNIFHKEESGFSSRANSSKNSSKKLLGFLLYAVIVPLPILDSFRLAIKYKNITFILHVVYLYYVCYEIFISYLFKFWGLKRYNNQYG